MRAVGKIVVHRPPGEFFLKEHIAAEPRMHHWRIRAKGSVGVDNRLHRGVVDLHHFGSVLCLCPGFSDNGNDPLTNVANDIDRKGVATETGRIECVCERGRRLRQHLTGQHRNHARRHQGPAGVYSSDPCGGIGAADKGNMLHARSVDIGDEAALSGEKPCILSRTTSAREKTPV